MKKIPIAAANADSFKHLLKEKQEEQRRKDSKELYDIFRHSWRKRIEKKMEDLFTQDTIDELRFQVSTDLNVLRWAADELGKIYAQPPKRTVGGLDVLEGAEDPLAPYLGNGSLDLALDQAARICYACRAVGIRPLVANAGKDNKPHIILDVIPPHKIFAIPDDTDLTRTKLVAIKKKNGCIVWDNESQVSYDDGWKKEEEQPNPYGCIPYIVAHAGYPAVDYWSTCDAFGLRDAAYLVAIAATEHNHLRRLQSHKQGWYRSDKDVPLSILTDPSRWIRLEGEGDAGLLDMQADLQGHLDSLLDRAAATLALYGIRPESVRGSLDASSGYALSLKLLSQEAAWAQQRRIWQVWEQRLYEVSREVLAVDASVALPEGEIKIDWAEIGAEATSMDKAELHGKYLDMKVVSRAWVQRQMGLTPEEVEQIEKERLEEGVGAMLPPAPTVPSGLPPVNPDDPPGQRDDLDE